jgi:hypothetical protein
MRRDLPSVKRDVLRMRDQRLPGEIRRHQSRGIWRIDAAAGTAIGHGRVRLRRGYPG